MNYDNQHKHHLQKYIKEVEEIFNKFIAQTSSVVLRAKLQDELFKFRKHPKITKDINLILNEFYNALLSSINVGTANEWQLANEKIDALKTLQLKQVSGKISQDILDLELSKIARSPRNTEALRSFQQRKINGFTISDRVWKITEQMRDELELAIDVSLAEGKSANQLAREIKKHLNNPDGLYRRVRDKHGNLVLSKNAKNFHPGQGVYRSSHKNALRLAKEEINTAYRESEQLRILQNNDVVGVEIYLSPSHKIYDICDELKGKYPKDFKWSKWHIGCMCHRRIIMKSEAEFIKELQNGENLPPESSNNFVADVPDNFKKWHKDNEHKFENWKRKPSFLEENQHYTNEKIRDRYKDYIKLKNDKDYTDVVFDRHTGGLKATHIKHKFDKQKGYYEKEVRDILFKNGDKIVLENEFGFGKKIEGYYNNIPTEIKTLENNNPRTIRKRIAQSVEKGAEISVLYFPKGFELNLSEVLDDYFGKIPKIILIDRDKVIYNDVK